MQGWGHEREDRRIEEEQVENVPKFAAKRRVVEVGVKVHKQQLKVQTGQACLEYSQWSNLARGTDEVVFCDVYLFARISSGWIIKGLGVVLIPQ